MKKLATLLLAAGLVFGAATGASAIDFKAKGEWVMNFDYGQGSKFMSEDRGGRNVYGWGGNGQNSGSKDNFNADQRVRLQLDAVASESLSGTVFFELGNQVWGDAAEGGALGADGKIVKLRRAYIDWIVPQTDLKFRMGIQGVSLPNYVFGGSQIFDADVAGITFSNKFNDNVTLTGFWLRPMNDNYGGTRAGEPAGYMDNMDLFGLTLPLSFDGVKVTPWAMIGAMGPNVWNSPRGSMTGEYNNLMNGMKPAVSSSWGGKSYDKLYDYSTTYHFGVTGEVTAWDPFRLAWDINYGAVQTNEQQLNRGGWYAALLAEYKLDWATPGLYGWYSSGDDDDVSNGSERMASIDANGTMTASNFGTTGSPYIGRDGVLGINQIGTWGIGARLKDMSFLEGLSHTFLINYMGGTNSPEMARYILGKKSYNGRVAVENVRDFNNNNGLYLTTADSALEFGLQNKYKIYDNLTMYFDVSYLALFLDDVWSKSAARGTASNPTGSFSQTDAWDVNLSFVYSF